MISKLFIDGSNLFRGIADVLPPGSFIDLTDILTEVRKDCHIDHIHLYAAYMSLNKAASVTDQLKAKAQIEFLNRARQIPGLSFYKGYYSTKGKEKGVDVHLAVDMVQQGLQSKFDQAIIMTGDDDLIYPIQILKQLHKKVDLAAFCSRYPFGISYHVNRCFLYDYQKYFSSNVLPTIKKTPRKLKIRDLPQNVPIHKVP